MAYTKTTWANGSAPAINATNLNKIESGIYDTDGALTTHLADTTTAHGINAKANASDLTTHTGNTTTAHALDSRTVKNWIINGQFDVWQRGTSQTAIGYGSDDRWSNYHGESTKTHSRQSFTVGQTDIPNNPTYFSRTVVASAGTASAYCTKFQKIEDVTKIAGKTISYSFWAKADASKNMAIEIIQDFGTGGSASVRSIGVQKFALTTSWQRFTKTVTVPSVAGKTIGTNNATNINIWFDAGSSYNSYTDSIGNQSGTFDIANVCLVEGSTAMECPAEPYDDVLRKCQRYYYKMLASVTYARFGLGQARAATKSTVLFQYPVEMRVPPTFGNSGSLALTPSDGVTNISVTSIENDQTTKFGCCKTFNVASGLVAGNATQLVANNDTSAFLSFDAEL